MGSKDTTETLRKKTTIQLEKERLQRKVEELHQEMSVFSQCLEYVRILRQQNKIEGLEIQSKIKELICQGQNKNTNGNDKFPELGSYKKPTKNANTLKLLDDAATVNKTKLNLDVNHRICHYDEECESEETD